MWLLVETVCSEQQASSSSTTASETKNNTFLHEVPLNANLIEFTYALGRVIKGRHLMFSVFEYLLSNQLMEPCQESTTTMEPKHQLYNDLYPIFQNCCDFAYIMQHKVSVCSQMIYDEKVNLKKICQKHLDNKKFIELSKIIDKIEKIKEEDESGRHVYLSSITCFNGTKSLCFWDHVKTGKSVDKKRKGQDHVTLRKVLNINNEKTKVNVRVTTTFSTPFHIAMPSPSTTTIPTESTPSETNLSSEDRQTLKKRKQRQLSNFEEHMLSNQDENGSFFSIKKKKVEHIGPRRLKIPDDLALKKEHLDIIEQSNMLKNRLRDDRLQQMIMEVDQSHDREKVLEFFLESEPEFLTFCEQVLYVLGRRDENDLKAIHDLMKKQQEAKQQWWGPLLSATFPNQLHVGIEVQTAISLKFVAQ